MQVILSADTDSAGRIRGFAGLRIFLVCLCSGKIVDKVCMIA